MRVLFLLVASTALAAPGVKWGTIPFSFEPNTGQTNREVQYLARGSAYTLYLSNSESVLAAKNQSPLRIKLLGANPSARIVGESQQASTSNYFVGNDPSKWHTSVQNYGRIRYTGLYPGIDLVYYGNEGKLEYDWILSPGADPKNIRLVFDGADQLRIDKQGDLMIKLGKNEYRHRKPLVYQEVEGKRVPVSGRWRLHGREGSFRIGAYDHRRALVIDPVMIYSTYLGGTGLDYAYAIAVDRAGNTYVTGTTGSTNFPTGNPLQGSLRGAADVFVTKINANGTAKLYSTYLGGGGMDAGNGIAVDSNEEVYVTGSAGSFDFPTLGAIQGTWGGSGDAFLTKLNASGSALVYSTYMGGNAIDYGTAIALDPTGNAYITGVTFSTNFPTVNPFQAVRGAQQDAFIAKINPAGTAWVYSTYLGGNNVDEGYGIAADTSGNAYVTGYTASTDFPLQSPYRSSNSNSVDAFVTKLNAEGSALVYSTYLGGLATDYGTAIAVDSAGSAYVTGVVSSTDFPVVNPMQPKLAVASDAFVTKFNPTGSALVYSTYLGGGSTDQAYALAIDPAGNAYVTGRTNSGDFPLTNPLRVTLTAFDMFVTELNASGTARLFSTFLGGSGSESGRGIAVDSQGNIHIAGEGTSTDFPVVNAIQTANGGGAVPQDALVLLVGQASAAAAPFGSIDTPANNVTGVSGAIGVTGWALSSAGTANVGIWREPVAGETPSANGLVFIVTPTIVPGARPDVAQLYPGYPNNNAGWGAQILTNMLPNTTGTPDLGNGTYRLHVIVTDNASQVVDLGVRTITVNNNGAVLPFGTIDTPGQGATASGAAYVNFGWALTPNPANVIPKDGSTIWVFIDNQPAGHPVYNNFRSDIATLFPGLQNSNGAVGYFMIDTTKLVNGLHTIAWSATDNAGNAQGLGSRFFVVQN